MAKNSFNKIAKAYYSSTPTIPQKYTDLLQETFQTKPEDRIIDLGCGSGDIALMFAKKSSFVEGIDSSKTMIEMAQKKDAHQKVTWIYKSVDDFNFESEKYQLIFTYEAFHLFQNHVSLIKKCSKALKPGGFLGIGWTMYEWDFPLKQAIKETFADHGIFRGEWGLWTCPKFPADVIASKTDLTVPLKKTIGIKSQTPVSVITNYILNNSKSTFLSNDLKSKIAKDLEKRFLKIYPSGESHGYTRYSLMYCKKIS